MSRHWTFASTRACIIRCSRADSTIRSGSHAARLIAVRDLADALSRDMGPRAELDPLGKRTIGVFEALVQGRHRYGAERHRQFHRQRHERR